MASARAPLFTADPPRNMLRESFVATSQRYQLFPDVGKSGLFSQFFEAPGLRAAMLRAVLRRVLQQRWPLSPPPWPVEHCGNARLLSEVPSRPLGCALAVPVSKKRHRAPLCQEAGAFAAARAGKLR